MTVSSTILRNDYTANGSQTVFPFTFQVLEEGSNYSIKVVVTDTDGVETTKVFNTDYTVTLNADGTGSVTFTTAPTLDHKVTLLSNISKTQETDYISLGTDKFPADSHEKALDKLTLITQELEEKNARAILLPESSTLTDLTIPVSAANADKAIVVNGTGDNLDAKNLADIGTAPVTDYAKTLLDDTTASEAQSTLGISTYAKTLLDDTDAATARATLDAEQKINSLTAITALEDADQLAVSDSSDSNNSKKITYANLKSDLSSIVSNPNLIINGQGLIGQRGLSFTSSTTPSNSDDTYLLDRMLLLSDGNDIVDVSRETSEVPQGAYSSIKFDVETANKQFAYCQILEAKKAVKIIGGNASLSFKAKKGGSNATLETLRAAVISWDGTEDTVTTDLVATWAGAGTNPTLATNWTYENTPSDLTLTTSFQTFKIENVSIDTASAKNVAVLIWCDDTDATVGDLVYIGDIKLEEGSISTPYKSESIENIILKCQRFYEKSYNLNVVPATITYEGVYNYRCVTTDDKKTILFKAMKRANPSIIIYNPETGATGTWRNGSRSSNDSVTPNRIGEQGFVANSSGHVAAGDQISGHWIADAEL